MVMAGRTSATSQCD